MVDATMFRRYRKIDLMFILVLAILWIFSSWIINLFFHQFGIILSLFVSAMFVTFAALMINKLGAVTLFYVTGSFMIAHIDKLHDIGIYKAPILVITGIIFELSFLLLKIRVQNIPLDVILGAAFSNFSIPFTMLLFVTATKEVMPYVWNFALMSFFAGIIGSIITFLIWYNIRGTKLVIKFEYSI